MIIRSLSVLSAFSLVILSTPSRAERPGEAHNQWRWHFQAAAVHRFEADFDDGGKLEVDRFFASLGGMRHFSDRWRIGVEIGYGSDDYAFSGDSGFGALDPWNEIRELRIGLPIRYFANADWTVFAIPSLRFQSESGASLSDGKNGGLLAAAIYRFNENFSIGPGLGVFSEIEDDTSVFPILLLDWRITDRLSLETGGGFAASRGPGLQLSWKSSPHWRFAFGGRYESNRFRLDDKGPARGGVGQDTAVPLFALAEYSWSQQVKLSVIGGAEVGGNLRLEDRDGIRVSDDDLDTAPFLGVTFRGRF